MQKIAIIGAGPAGIFSSLLLKNSNFEIHLFEENHQIGKKLKITGNGKMNVTNKIFLKNFGHSKNFL
ncbi:NAD(P)/FAD-dependent oxidoreductase [Candidatus Gracilibacteria bacterium]|nr:NAD(P)/FAD-dependent oxidoreductase [Candidatus Gracilibacteria bacterium]